MKTCRDVSEGVTFESYLFGANIKYVFYYGSDISRAETLCDVFHKCAGTIDNITRMSKTNVMNKKGNRGDVWKIRDTAVFRG